MKYVVGRLVCNFFAVSRVSPKGATYSVIEEIDVQTQKGVGQFFLVDEKGLDTVELGEGDQRREYKRAPANFELLLPYPVTEKAEGRE